MKNLIIIAIAIISLALTSCSNIIKGEGMVVTETFEMDDFSKIELKASYDVIIKQGTEQEVVVEGQQNIIDRVQLNVINGNLTMDLQNGSYRNMELIVHITSPNLDKIYSNGSGDITIKDLDAEDMEFEINGSGDITATEKVTITDKMKLNSDGSGDMRIDDLVADDVIVMTNGSGNIQINDGATKDLDVTLDGSGDVKLFDLESEDCVVVSKGSGDTRVKATNDLEVTISGSGDVKYKGNPQIDVVDDGSGDLINAN